MTFEVLSQAATCMPGYFSQWKLHAVTLYCNAERLASEAVNNVHFLNFLAVVLFIYFFSCF